MFDDKNHFDDGRGRHLARLGANVPRSLREELQRRASAQGLSLAEMTRRALERGIASDQEPQSVINRQISVQGVR